MKQNEAVPLDTKAADVISGQEVCGFYAKEVYDMFDWPLTQLCSQ